MTAISWAAPGEKHFELGLDRGVLYVPGLAAVPWNGLVRVIETPTGGEKTSYYQEGRKYLERSASEEFGGSIEAFTYPEAFELCDGSLTNEYGIQVTQQERRPFNFSYRTLIGNDLVGADFGHKIHLIYNALVAPTSKTNAAQSGSPSAMTMSWDFTTTPIDVGVGFLPSAHIILDSRKINPEVLRLLETYLYGSEALEPRMLTVAELNDYILQGFTLEVVDNGDGTWTATGSEGEITYLTSSMFRLSGPTVTMVDSRTFQLRSISDLEG